MFCFVFFPSFFGFSQINAKDSVWVSVYKKNNKEDVRSVVDYHDLYYRNIQVPVCDSIGDNQKLIPIAQNIEKMLLQTHLDNSYTVSEVKGTALEESLKNVEKFSYPFSSCITPKLAAALNIKTNTPELVASQEILNQLVTIDSNILSTTEMLQLVHQNSNIRIDKGAYLRFRLLSFLIGSSNMGPNKYSWTFSTLNKQKIIPYINSYQNQYMSFDGTYKLISKLIRSYQHFESYDARIKNIRKISQQYVGFDVNILSSLPYEVWEQEIAAIQSILNEKVIDSIKKTLPKGVLSTKTEQLFTILSSRVANLNAIAIMYYNLISPNKIVTATNVNNLIDIHRNNSSTSIKIYNEKEGKKIPVKSYDFSSKETDEIWVYGLKGNDYFEVYGESKSLIPIVLIGGENSDKYEIQNGNKVVIHDNKSQTFIVEKDKAKVCLSEEAYITTYNQDKYKHSINRIKPKFGANPDDGLFLGIVDEYKVFGFDQQPYSQLHRVAANLYLGTLGFKIGYYGEKANIYKGFSAFCSLGYQSPNYSTNFFGFGNETPNYDNNLKLNYNRVRMSTFDAKMGVVKRHKYYFVSGNLFFESKKIAETPDRFVSSETLFFPSADFFDRKNYVGISGTYKYKNLSLSVLDKLMIVPKINVKLSADINEFSKTNMTVHPSLYLEHPMYGNKITIDVMLAYKHVFGGDIPFFQAANLGGSTGIRGYRNERFTGQSLAYVSTNLKWHIKDLKSEVLPLQLGLLGGFDCGRVWQEEESSSLLHTDFGAGLWLQTADLIKAQLQAFKGDEGLRISFNLAVGF